MLLLGKNHIKIGILILIFLFGFQPEAHSSDLDLRKSQVKWLAKKGIDTILLKSLTQREEAFLQDILKRRATTHKLIIFSILSAVAVKPMLVAGVLINLATYTSFGNAFIVTGIILVPTSVLLFLSSIHQSNLTIEDLQILKVTIDNRLTQTEQNSN